MNWQGLDEFRSALRDLPADLRDDADVIVDRKANEADSAIRVAYPIRTGNLRKGVRLVEESASEYGVSYLLENRAKHAAIFEWGTVARHTSIGANRGSMPVGKVFVPIMIRKRREMYDELRAMMTDHGLTVTG